MFIRHDVKSKNDEKPKRERFGPEVSSVNQLTFYMQIKSVPPRSIQTALASFTAVGCRLRAYIVGRHCCT